MNIGNEEDLLGLDTPAKRFRDEGRAEGRAEGHIEGAREARMEMVAPLKNRGFSPAEIAEVTGLPINEIEAL